MAAKCVHGWERMGCEKCAPITVEQGDRIIELLEQLAGSSAAGAEAAELATHRDGCKCGRC